MIQRIKGSTRLLLVYFALLFGVIVAFALFASSYLHWGQKLHAAPFPYPNSDKWYGHCKPVRGIAADHVTQRNPAGTSYTITTPSNYHPGRAHPLLVVWAPAMMGPWLNEHFIGLTQQATQAGFIIVYVASRSLSINSILAMESIPLAVSENWCVNPSAVFYTGHSDGGTIANGLALLPESNLKPRAIAPSAAGTNQDALNNYDCPTALNVMVMHNSDDKHFPQFGLETAQWWRKCNDCQVGNPKPTSNGCLEYRCKNNIVTLYCESIGGHLQWNGDVFNPVNFFERFLQ